MKLFRRGLVVLIAVLAVAAAAFAASTIHQRSVVGDRRRQATADAADSARRYAAKLVPAFSAGSQTIASLEELERGTQVTHVSAVKESTSVVVDVQATAVYPGARSAAVADACLRVILFRTDGAITDRIDGIPCDQAHTTSGNEVLTVG
ncbi:hypothetical protein ACIRVF_30550 [Kitasatospora sp. NPDC101157]|uniref:hypothetical protein n=1 Tax=Kitasatospora sp. NPDC101157 TaxID=3364098 RepID=UPI0038210F5A